MRSIGTHTARELIENFIVNSELWCESVEHKKVSQKSGATILDFLWYWGKVLDLALFITFRILNLKVL